MKAINFRIGNLLQSKEWGGVGKIEGIEAFENHFEIKIKGYIHKIENSIYQDLEPIPLNVNWLNKNVFYELNENQFLIRQQPIEFRFVKNIIDDYFYFKVVNNFSVRLAFVHELQNIYYSLTSRELEIINPKYP